jgi:hypothetical protein
MFFEGPEESHAVSVFINGLVAKNDGSGEWPGREMIFNSGTMHGVYTMWSVIHIPQAVALCCASARLGSWMPVRVHAGVGISFQALMPKVSLEQNCWYILYSIFHPHGTENAILFIYDDLDNDWVKNQRSQ